MGEKKKGAPEGERPFRVPWALLVGRCSGFCSRGCGGRRGRCSGGRSGLLGRLGCLLLLAPGNGKNHGNCGNGYDYGDLLHVISPPFLGIGRSAFSNNKYKSALRRTNEGTRKGTEGLERRSWLCVFREKRQNYIPFCGKSKKILTARQKKFRCSSRTRLQKKAPSRPGSVGRDRWEWEAREG